MAASHSRVSVAKLARNEALEAIRLRCRRRARELKQACAHDRESARARAREVTARERAIRRFEREQFRRGRMTAAENDSLAEKSIPAEHMAVWDQVRHQFSYDLAPDHRAELFGEWLQEHPSEVTAVLADDAERIDWAAREAAYYGEQDDDEEIPF